MVIKVKADTPPDIPINDNIKEKIKLLMAKRYVPETKALDLSKFSSDPGNIYFVSLTKLPFVYSTLAEGNTWTRRINLRCSFTN